MLRPGDVSRCHRKSYPAGAFAVARKEKVGAMSAQRQTTPRSQPPATKSTADKAERRARGQKPKAPEPSRRDALAARTGRLRATYQDTLSEVRKVNWPDQETTRNLTIVVIGISVVMGALLGSIDFVLIKLLGLF